MTTPYDEVQDNATGGAGEGEPALPVGGIELYVDSKIDSFANFVTDPGDIPTTATGRANGVFFDTFSLLRYLENGGLVGYVNVDPVSGIGEPVPIGWVYVLKKVDPTTGEIQYEVWIDEETDTI